jgi:hypothetical protein
MLDEYEQFSWYFKCTNPRLYESGNQGIKYIGLNLMYQLRAKP